jgi:transcriptional regulator with XRE-family HTH domain
MGASSTLARRLDLLFKTKRNEDGREYTYREAARTMERCGEISFSPTYLWGLRTGKKTNPTMRHLQALARFFDVAPSYFFDEELTQVPENGRLLAATRHEALRHVADGILGLSDDSLNTLLNLACRLRQLEGLPLPD